MKIRLKHRILASLLAMLTLTSALGMNLDVHYCGGEVKSFNLWGEAEPCEMMKQQEEPSSTHACCHTKAKAQIKKCKHDAEAKGICCHNESYSVGSSDNFEAKTFVLNFATTLFDVPNHYGSTNLFTVVKSELNHFHYYHPPPIKREINILYQVFRI